MLLSRGTSDSLHPTRSGKALCLPHAGDHSNLTARLMNPTVGVGMFLSASAVEKAQLASSFRYWEKRTQEEAGFPGQKQLLKNSIQGPLSKTQCTQ